MGSTIFTFSGSGMGLQAAAARLLASWIRSCRLANTC